MTPEEIDQLTPGPAMDDLIVQHVYGKNPLEARVGVDPENPERPQWYWGYPVGHDFAPNYSTDVAAAWDLYHHVVNTADGTVIFDLSSVVPGSGDGVVWECRLDVWMSDRAPSVGTGDTAPEALCKAALKFNLPSPSAPTPPRGGQMNGMTIIENERKRQIEVEGWSPEHDDAHADGELATAGVCYLEAMWPDAPQPETWPWDSRWWKPKGRLHNLRRGGALFMAERDRLLRKLARTPESAGFVYRNGLRRRVAIADERIKLAAAEIDALSPTPTAEER